MEPTMRVKWLISGPLTAYPAVGLKSRRVDPLGKRIVGVMATSRSLIHQ